METMLHSSATGRGLQTKHLFNASTIDSDSFTTGHWPQATTLLLGIHSWPNPDASRRRAAIRQLSQVNDAVAMRFIMPFRGSHTENDILRFELGPPGKSRLLQKYLIANAFLACAASLKRYTFVGRSEDDAMVDAAALASHLASLRLRVSGPILYGVRGEWVMWAPETMTPVCWAMSLRRWELQRRRDALALPPRNGTFRPSGECHTANVGPSLLVKGPLVRSYATRANRCSSLTSPQAMTGCCTV